MSEEWNIGDVLDAVDAAIPGDRPALIHGDRVVRWTDFSRRSNNLARNLLNLGVRPGDKIAFYMRNRPEYSEGIAAALKARLVHVNVNYRYIDSELIYLLDNSDAKVCIYAAEFAPLVASVRGSLPEVKHWVEVDDGAPGGEDAVAYETLAAIGDGSPLEIERSPDDLIFLYTGGTTGMPKGVMWRHGDLWVAHGGGGNPRLGQQPSASIEEHQRRVSTGDYIVSLPLPPLMHGTGFFMAMRVMYMGGTCVTLEGKSFDADEALKAIGRNGVTNVTIVGDAFARPMLELLDANPGVYDISSIRLMNSSGVMWTRSIKEGLLRHNENMTLSDSFASSEALGMGASVTTKGEVQEVAHFKIGVRCRVFSEDFSRQIEPGSGESGLVAVTGPLPMGYYKDSEKTDKTFKTIDGVRYSVPGDWVKVEPDGTLTLLGRGSNCINTAGEKVYPEEVEEALKHHPSVADCLVVGVADEKWGQAITAVVQLQENAEMNEAELRDFARTRLAAYKIPKRVLARASLERAPNGKANYELIREYAESELLQQAS